MLRVRGQQWHLGFRLHRHQQMLVALVGRLRLGYRTLFWLPAATGSLWGLLLFWDAQLRQLYLSAIEAPDPVRLLLALLCLLILCGFLYAWNSKLSTDQIGRLYSQHADLRFDRRLLLVRDLKAASCFLLPLCGLVLGLYGLYGEVKRAERVYSAAGDLLISRGGEPQAMSATVGWIAVLVGIAVAGSIWPLLRYRVWLCAFSRSYTIGCCIGLAMVVALLPFAAKGETVNIAKAVGPLAMSFLTMMVISVVLFPVSRRHLLLMPLAAAIAMIGSYKISTIGGWATIESGASERPSAMAYFDAWLEERRKHPDGRAYANYPVYVFAVEGGGIYAVSAAARYLSTLQGICPQFARHVFAISGVSGGAIGAAIFQALNARQLGGEDPVNCLEAARQRRAEPSDSVVRIICSDHLSGPLAFLIPDTIRKFDFGALEWISKGLYRLAKWMGERLPMAQRAASFLGGSLFDRSSALEKGFADEFDAAQAHPADSPCVSGARSNLRIGYAYHACAASKAPALLLNTTWVERGYRVTFSPFRLWYPNAKDVTIGDGTLLAFDDLGRPEDPGGISLISAAGVSARFPGIMPSWPVDYHLGKGETRRWNFVDGGYADASGATTAYELFDRLEQHVRANNLKVDLRLVLLTDAATDLELKNIEGSGFNDSLVVVTAILNVRSLLAQRAVTGALTSAAASGTRDKVQVVNLVHQALPLSLGWMISRRSDEVVQYILGDATYCGRQNAAHAVGSADDDAVKALLKTIDNNSCATREILQRLSVE